MKLLIVILVLIVMLFVLALAVGLSQDDSDVSLVQPGWLQWMQSRLEEEPVQPSDLLTDCLQETTLFVPLRSTCRIRVRRSDARLRKMRLRLLNTADEVRVNLEPNTENGVSVKVKLDGNMTKTPKLVFVKGRDDPPLVATIELTCDRAVAFPPSGCRLLLE